MKVRQMMTTDVVSARPDMPLKHVAELLVTHRISGLPVLDDKGQVVGVISEADFVARESGDASRSKTGGWLAVFAPDREGRRKLDAMAASKVEDAMSRPAVTIGPEDPLDSAARLMSGRKINRLPVVEDGKLVGIISRADIVRVYARGDDEVKEQAAYALRAVDGLRVTGVRDGVVELSGSVYSEAIATTVRSVIEHLDGVIAVDDSRVSWTE
jgi:CBS domain-containing protein